MGKIIPRLKQEILGTIPTVAFFFIIFQLLAFTRALTLKTYDIHVSTFMNATIAALVVGLEKKYKELAWLKASNVNGCMH